MTPVILSPSRLPGGLLAAAGRLGAGWERGVTVGSSQCLAANRQDGCHPNPITADRTQPSEDFVPSIQRVGVECSTANMELLATHATATADATLDYELAQLLLTGERNTVGTPDENVNPSLSDLDLTAGTCANLATAVAVLEEAAATALRGRTAFIHIPTVQAVAAKTLGLWADDNGQLRTPLGNVVVLSAGYSGDVVYATGEVWVGVGDLTVEDPIVQRHVNTGEVWADRPIVAVFDTCWGTGIEVTPPACEGDN